MHFLSFLFVKVVKDMYHVAFYGEMTDGSDIRLIYIEYGQTLVFPQIAKKLMFPTTPTQKGDKKENA